MRACLADTQLRTDWPHSPALEFAEWLKNSRDRVDNGAARDRRLVYRLLQSCRYFIVGSGISSRSTSEAQPEWEPIRADIAFE